MNIFFKSDSKLNNQKGAVTPLVIIFVLFLALPLAALTIDLAHLYVVRNQLQNAADAAALAGAAQLYDPMAEAINVNANEVAYQTLINNVSEGVPVTVNYVQGTGDTDNNQDIQRGHWAFATAGDYPVETSYFQPNDSSTALNIAGRSTEDLNADDNFINAVYVKARPNTFSVVMFFARIFGIESLQISAESVAYLGFAGTLGPGELDIPIAICEESVLDPDTGLYDCNIGRMINSGSNDATHNTAGWTDFSQPCSGGTNASALEDIIIDPDSGDCSQKGNPDWIIFNKAIGATGGQVTSVLTDFLGCWKVASNDIVCDDTTNPPTTTQVPIVSDGDMPDQPWEVTVPIIQCPGNNVENCPILTGAASVTLRWVNPKSGVDFTEAPEKMYLGIPTVDNCTPDNITYGPSWPDDIVVPGESTNILDVAINTPYNGDSLLHIMEVAFAESNQFSQIASKLEAGYGANWAGEPLGVLFYEDFVSSADHGPVRNDKSSPGSGYEGAVRWASFVKTFGLKNVDDQYAPYQAAGIYFQPTCTPHDVAGDTGGENYGIIADRPVLVFHELLHAIRE